VQFGTFSPQLRTHSSKRSPARAIWTYPQPYFAVMKRFYRLRARLVPYIATMARVAHDSGLPLVRPLYYAHPEAPAAYADQGLHQFAFGDAIWAAPIAAPAPGGFNSSSLGKVIASGGDAAVPRAYFNVSGAAVTPWTFWAPPGKWVEWFSWEAFSSPAPHGAFFARRYAIGEMPLFSPPGAIVPLRTLPANGGGVLGLSSTVPAAITLYVFGGVEAPRGGPPVVTRARIYDDDGVSVGYEHGEFLWTDVDCAWARPAAGAAGGDTATCTVHAPTGAGFAAAPPARAYTLRLLASLPPAAVSVNGAPVPHDALATPDANGDNGAFDAGVAAWSYDGATGKHDFILRRLLSAAGAAAGML
jgi:alpha-glucosidase (family GH31 glycosyl hydrolase)